MDCLFHVVTRRDTFPTRMSACSPRGNRMATAVWDDEQGLVVCDWVGPMLSRGGLAVGQKFDDWYEFMAKAGDARLNAAR